MPALLLAMFATLLQQPGPLPPPPQMDPAVEVAPGIHLIRGAVVRGRGPDGNTIILEAPDGLIVVDTGRHTYHSDAILAFASARKRPIAAIVNTHWHLDHSSGNRRLKAAFPAARVYTTRAIDRVIAPGGFLVRDLERVRGLLEKPDVPELQKDEIRIFLATMDVRDTLEPDIAVERSATVPMAGRSIDVRVTDGAVSDADVWIYEPDAKVAIVGDLITMPVPFFETACPDRWTASLNDVWATPFTTAIPGHGPPMSRSEFDTYRQAFGKFVACVRSDAAPPECAATWTDGIAALLGDDRERRTAVTGNASYYVGYLRDNGGKAPDCKAR
jgi:glyoxylase-like metal-dependent hydrolase (beta-lactamase superfamily II)